MHNGLSTKAEGLLTKVQATGDMPLPRHCPSLARNASRRGSSFFFLMFFSPPPGPETRLGPLDFFFFFTYHLKGSRRVSRALLVFFNTFNISTTTRRVYASRVFWFFFFLILFYHHKGSRRVSRALLVPFFYYFFLLEYLLYT